VAAPISKEFLRCIVLRIGGWNGLCFIPAGITHAAGFEIFIFFGGHVPDFIHPGHSTRFPLCSETTPGKKAKEGSCDEKEEKHLHNKEGHKPGKRSKKEATKDGFENLRFHFL